MDYAYKTDRIEQHGQTYKIEWFYDNYYGAPWEEHDGHGPVSGWERRDKRPGELILNEDRGARRFYDFQAAVKQARAECWNSCRNGTEAAEAARLDFEYLRRWCANDWHWCGIVVTMLDDGEEIDISAVLWGIEDQGYLSDHAPIIQDLIGECEYQLNRMTYPVTACGV